MIKKALPTIHKITFRSAYGLLQHKKMDEVKAKLYSDKEKTLLLKMKFFAKQMKYTLVQGSKDLWADVKWLRKLKKTKPRFEFTGY